MVSKKQLKVSEGTTTGAIDLIVIGGQFEKEAKHRKRVNSLIETTNL